MEGMTYYGVSLPSGLLLAGEAIFKLAKSPATETVSPVGGCLPMRNWSSSRVTTAVSSEVASVNLNHLNGRHCCGFIYFIGCNPLVSEYQGR